MPKRFITYSRTEPARTILWSVAFLTVVVQAVTLLPAIAGLAALPNFLIVAPIGVWGVWSATKNNINQMANSSFWLFMIWLFSGVLQLNTATFGTMLWAPMLVVAASLSVVYLYLSYARRTMGDGDLD